MATVDDLDYMESTSEEGVYQLNINFDYNADRDVAYQDVLAKMGLVKKTCLKEARNLLSLKLTLLIFPLSKSLFRQII
jgi:multidrug efflux pump subunit AcrB